MKNFFSPKGNFNIFIVIGFSIMFACINLPRNVAIPLVLLAILISWIPIIYQGLISYKESKKTSKIIRPILALLFIIFLIIFQII
ncbi:Uncharacterised protein [[Clostridium] sordellii]|uniref:Uncharacterized protein n=1 Tax=Paraclostridium sordellii TaxID=1505 RepID=A0A0C7QHR1_PARSO|nr:Uncharacterised protein [[Clostridium] sordellii] [Paeniclostridium sordellii]